MISSTRTFLRLGSRPTSMVEFILMLWLILAVLGIIITVEDRKERAHRMDILQRLKDEQRW